MVIEIKEQDNSFKTDVFLMDGERIVEYKISLPDNFVGEFINNLTIRYSLPKELIIKDNAATITLDDYVKSGRMK